MQSDKSILRELAKEVAEIAQKPIQDERRDLWRRHNSLQRVKPPIYVGSFAFEEIFDMSLLKCEDPFLRDYEYHLHTVKARDTIGDDNIIEPWLTVQAVFEPTRENRWGVRVGLGEAPVHGGAAAFAPELFNEEDIDRLVIPVHKVNEEATRESYDKLQNAVGDIMPVHVNRSSIFNGWTQDISTDLARLRGLEQIMWDAYDRPEWLHRLLTFMRDGILKVHEEAEKAGDFSQADHRNQAMPYAEELTDPKPGIYGVQRNELWGYFAAQEFTTFGPDMFYEFMLQYQMPIMEKFALTAYGCCEDLAHKIDQLRKIPNLRRIAVTPFTDVRKCAEQIGTDYIASWRPNPSNMVSTGLDEDFVRRTMRENFAIFKENGSYFDITLKDVETVNHQPENVAKWVKIVREELERAF